MRSAIYKFLYCILICLAVPGLSQTKTEELYAYDIEERISELGIQLSEPKLPPGINIVFVRQSGNVLYLSGNGPILKDGTKISGKVGSELSVEEAYEAARLTGINQLSVLKTHLGDLNKVVKIVKVLGMVNAGPDFTEQPAVINGFSDLMVEVFGERGRHARSAIGVSSLPWNLVCEVEMIVEIIDEP